MVVERAETLTGRLEGWRLERRRSDKGRAYIALISPDGKHFPSENAALRWLIDGSGRRTSRSEITKKHTLPKEKMNNKREKMRVRLKRVIYNDEGQMVPIEPQRALNKNLPHCGRYPAGDDLPHWTVEHAQTLDGTNFLLYRNPEGDAIGSRGSALRATNQLEVPAAICEQIGQMQEDARKRKRMLNASVCLPPSAQAFLSQPWAPVRDLTSLYDDLFKMDVRMALVDKMRRVNSIASKVLVVDLFCGIGGFSLGASSLGVGHLLGIDIEKGCAAAYVANRCGTKALVYRLKECDLTRWAALLWPFRDNLILLASPPCQPYSCTGANNGVSDQRDGMPFFTKLCTMVRPLGAILENVPTILQPKHAKAIDPQLERLREAGYEMMVDVVHCKDFDVAQKRRRAIGVFVRNDVPGRVQTPMSSLRLSPTSAELELAAGDVLKCPQLWGGAKKKTTIPTSLALRSRDRIRIGCEQTGLVFKNQLAPTVLTTSLHDNSYYRLFAVPDDKSPLKSMDLRALSVQDVLTLQGFPTNYKMFQHTRFQGHCAGNAIPPPLARAATSTLLRALRTIGCTPPPTDLNNAIHTIKDAVLSW